MPQAKRLIAHNHATSQLDNHAKGQLDNHLMRVMISRSCDLVLLLLLLLHATLML